MSITSCAVTYCVARLLKLVPRVERNGYRRDLLLVSGASYSEKGLVGVSLVGERVCDWCLGGDTDTSTIPTLEGVTGLTFCYTLGSDSVIAGDERTGDSVGGLKDGELFVVSTSV